MTDPATDIRSFDPPDIREADAKRARLDLLKTVFRAPEWRLLLQFLQDRGRDRLVTVLYGTEDKEVEQAKADLRAIIAIGIEFGVADIQVAGQLFDLEAMIQQRRDAMGPPERRTVEVEDEIGV